ncbi:MAG: isocitrate lyase/PEP mutase family protein [Solirubrobacterales bacterium]
MSQLPATRAQALNDMHRTGELLVVANAWDVASARTLVAAGFPTLATTSAGVAWSAGFSDGQAMPVEEMLAAVARIANSVDVPISADFEAGYTDATGGIDETVRALIDAGVAGVNVEDGAFDGSSATGIVNMTAHADLIRGAREAANELGVPLFINGRTDVYWRGVGEPERRLEEAMERLRAFGDAGADCAFAPGLTDGEDIAALAESLPIPLNVMSMPGMPSLAELARLGVARVTVGANLLIAALGLIEQIANELRDGQLIDHAGPSEAALRAVMGG